jgi:hypothetical protein
MTHTIAHIRAVDASKTSAQNSRLTNVQAAAQDPTKKVAFKNAVSGLRRLGLEIEQIAASGNVSELDKAMTALGWTQLERFTLKNNLHACGAIE